MPAATIAYFVHGRGRGHASRALSLIPALRRAGHEVLVLASGDALEMLASLGPAEARPLLKPGARAWAELWRRRGQETGFLRAQAARLVISDGDQGALLGARTLGLPSLAIGHDLVFGRCELPRELSRRHLTHQRLNALIPTYLSTRRIAVSFVPLRSHDPHTEVARPEIARPEIEQPAASAPRDRLVCYFRDGSSERLLALARNLDAEVIAYPAAGSALLLPRDEFRALLCGARGVIGSAGSNLIAECVTYGVPMLALHLERDSEQALNGAMLQAAGLGTTASFETLDRRKLQSFWAGARAGAFRTLSLTDELPSFVERALHLLPELLGR